MPTQTTLKRIPSLRFVLFALAVVALIFGFTLIWSARHGNLERAPGEVQWYREAKEKHLEAEGFPEDEARRHAFIFGYFYTLFDDVEFAKRRFTMAYASLSFAILCVIAASALPINRNEK